MTFLQTILRLIKLESFLIRNTISQVLRKMMKPMSKAITYILYQKWSDTIYVIIFNLYQY